MPRIKVLRRSLLAALALLLLVAVVVLAVSVTVVIRRPLPSYAGDVTLTDLSSEVTVIRDAQGVPQIYADDSLDLFRAQGYVQAQDRFFEMDYRRHVTAGRLSELVGVNETALTADKTIRTMGWRDVAKQEWELLSPQARSYLTAYAEGVNDYIRPRTPSEISVAYTALDMSGVASPIEPWSPIDSLAWLKALAWDLRGNFDAELERGQDLAVLGSVARVDELFPAYDDAAHLPILANQVPMVDAEASSPAVGAAGASQTDPPAASTSYPGEAPGSPSESVGSAMTAARTALSSVPVLVGAGDGVGSNSWVVSGALTDTGKPLLANDPHLAIGTPGIWYQSGLHCNRISAQCPFNVSGFSFSGFPGVFIGHNDSLAWGLTNMGADVTDFFLERVSGSTYRHDDDQLPITSKTETIKVAGGDPVQLTIRSTMHGPIISDVMESAAAIGRTPIGGEDSGDGSGGGAVGEAGEDDGYAVALSWTALTPGRTAEAIFAMDTAKDASDVKAAAAMFEVPAQNIVFATRDGHIGYQAPGKIPVRGAVPDPIVPADGTWPRPGWISAYDWQGYVNPADMPSVLDPAEGFIVAANQAVYSADRTPFLTNDWDYGYRSQRIRSLLSAKVAAGQKITAQDMSQMQSDGYNSFAQMVVPYLLNLNVPDQFTREAVDLLRTWDFSQSVDSPAAAYFASVWTHILQLTFWDELPEDTRPTGGSRWGAVLEDLLEDPTSPWWDNVTTTTVVETRDQVLLQAVTDARLELTTRLGKEPTAWRWGQLHQASLLNPVMGGETVPSAVRALFNPEPIEVPGGSAIVNAMAWDASARTETQGWADYSVTSGPSMRMVVDLGDLDRSTWVNQTGESGHPGSVHYTDQIDAWAGGESFPWPFSRAAVDESAVDTLTLHP